MFDFDRPDQPYFTSARLVRSCEAAEARLAPLLAVVTPLARRRPDDPVSAELHGLARSALKPARRVALALALPPGLPLHAPLTHAGLAARLSEAVAQAARFRERYFRFDEGARRKVWFVHTWAVARIAERQAIARLEGRSPDRDAPPPEPKISPGSA